MTRSRAHEEQSDLRARVLAASAALLSEEGLSSLSMREVARRAGVSHQAPYHHFADRESILAALVAEGFDELATRLRAAIDGAEAGDPRAIAAATGEAYVHFALDRPGVFRIMFRPEVVGQERFPEARAAADRAFAQLERMVRMLEPGAGVEQGASMHWSFVHGLATLLLDGKLGADHPSPEARARHVSDVMGLFARRLYPATPPEAAKKPARRR